MSAYKLSARRLRHWYATWLAEVLDNESRGNGWDHGLHASLGPTPMQVGIKLGIIDYDMGQRRAERCRQFAEYRQSQAVKAAEAAKKAAPPRVEFGKYTRVNCLGNEVGYSVHGAQYPTREIRLDGERVGLIIFSKMQPEMCINSAFQVTFTNRRTVEHFWPECGRVALVGDPRKNKRAARDAVREWVTQRLTGEK